MAFKEMRKQLIEDGLLDKDGKLTQKGHDYVQDAKKDYDKRIKPFNYEDPAVEKDVEKPEPCVWAWPY